MNQAPSVYGIQSTAGAVLVRNEKGKFYIVFSKVFILRIILFIPGEISMKTLC